MRLLIVDGHEVRSLRLNLPIDQLPLRASILLLQVSCVWQVSQSC